MNKISRENNSTILLLSGGIDSATTGAILASDDYEIHALSFHYGQRHAHELKSATLVANHLCVSSHRIVPLDLANFGGSALTDERIQVPKDDFDPTAIPVTYVPARNTLFLSYALALAEVLSVTNIAIGVTAVDYSGYPDCRPEFIAAFEAMANLGTKAGVEGKQLKILTPLVQLSKAEIIARGIELGLDYSLTHSCYDPDPQGRACGHCDSCHLRKRGFEELGLTDPALAWMQ